MGNYKMDKASKPMLDVDGQIQHLLSKGVRFEITSEADAREYLRKITITLSFVPIERIFRNIRAASLPGNTSISILLC